MVKCQEWVLSFLGKSRKQNLLQQKIDYIIEHKQMFDDVPVKNRKIYIKWIKDPSKADEDERYDFQMYHLRLTCFPFPNETFRDETFNTPTGFISFDESLQYLHPAWSSSESSFIFHRDHPCFKDVNSVLCQRWQINNSKCYMHSAITLQRYLIAMYMCKHNLTLTNLGMIDMSCHIYKFNTSKFRNYIFNICGESSVEFLREILIENSVIEISSNLICKDKIILYGPGLVSGFKWYNVSEDGLHSMLIVGVRYDVLNNTNYYLLQNWWKYQQFFEVSEDELLLSNAVVYFVSTPQPNIPEKYVINSGVRFAANILDRPEGRVNEGNYDDCNLNYNKRIINNIINV